MSRKITVKPYQRAFRQPLRTAHGEWTIREGFVVRVEQEGCVGYGEAAPLPEFGSETVAEAAAFLQQLVRQPDLAVPTSLPCCAFAVSAAQVIAERGTRFDRLENVEAQLDMSTEALAKEGSASRVRYNTVVSPTRDYSVSALLPSGSAALRLATEKVDSGYRSMKWKIGVEPIAKEITMARSLIESLPAQVSVRFDANASLTATELEQWLEFLSSYREQVDYVEQPLACGEEAVMAACMEATGICIALDESLNGVDRERWLEPGAWAGQLVIKALLMGEVGRLRKRLEGIADRVVLSSVFETGVGLENSLCLADTLTQIVRPIGFDTVDAFEDELNPLRSASTICAAARSAYDPEQIWNSI